MQEQIEQLWPSCEVTICTPEQIVGDGVRARAFIPSMALMPLMLSLVVRGGIHSTNGMMPFMFALVVRAQAFIP